MSEVPLAEAVTPGSEAVRVERNMACMYMEAKIPVSYERGTPVSPTPCKVTAVIL